MMSAWPKLQGLLSEDEIESIPEILRSKLNNHVLNLQQVIEDLKGENAEIVAVSEKQQFQFEKEIFENQNQLKKYSESEAKQKELIAELEAELNAVKKELRENQSTFSSATLELQSVKRSNELISKEKQQLADQLERRRNDIEKLNEELANLVKQVTTVNEEKHAAFARAEEAEIQESKCQHLVNRLEQEKKLLEQQVKDFVTELSQKNHEIHTLKREKSTIVLELQSQVEHRSDEVYMLEKQVSVLKESVEEKDARIEALAAKVFSNEERSAQIEKQLNIELQAKSKLVELYEKASEANQNRVKELVSAFEEAQNILKDLSDGKAEAENECERIKEQCEARIKEMEKENLKLKEELKHANDLCQGKVFSSSSLESMFPTAAATSKALHSGMTLTHLYAEFVKAQEQIQRLKEENMSLQDQLKHILTEIEENTPVINERMKAYHESLETVTCLKTQLASALTDYDRISNEKGDLLRKANKLERDNHRLKAQVSDLNHQVQVLLKEVEETHQGRLVKLGEPREVPEVSSSDDITAGEVISRHLVTFRDIVELQTKNQQLLAVVRKLSEDLEEQEKKLTEEKKAELEKTLEITNSQLEELRNSRKQQFEMLESVVRQRDMFRVLLAHHGVDESLLGSPGGSAKGTRLSLSPRDRLDASTKSALHQLQNEFDNYKKQKAENEKVITERLDEAKNEVSSLRVSNAKLKSELEYRDERINILNSNTESYKKEATMLRDKNQKHSTLITQHQQTIQSLKHELMVCHEKIAKHEVNVENLKAEKELLKNSEQRLLHEKESLQREQLQKSQVLANLQSLQNNLERMESETKRSMQAQIEKYEKEINILQAKLDSANEDYRSAVAVWEKQNKDLQRKIDVEVEKNQKLHEDLVDAYSRVHAINQELNLAKAAGMKSDKGSTASTAKTEYQHANEIKRLKEQLNESKARSNALQEQLDIARKSSEQYMKMSLDLEMRIKELDEINCQLKNSMENALQTKEDAKRYLEQTIEDLEKNHRGLLEENMKMIQQKDEKIQELMARVATLENEVASNQNILETAQKTAEQAREDCLTQRQAMEEARDRYEREVLLHAQDIQTLSDLKEEHQNCLTHINELESLARKSESALKECKLSWQEQENMLCLEQNSSRERILELETQNSNLMQQLELLGTQMKAMQSSSMPALTNITSEGQDTQQLLEIIRFIKKEKEIVTTQLDSVQSENIRLKLKAEQMTRDLNECKAELKELQDSAQVKAISETQHSEMLRKVEMMGLLTESNSLLRIEKEELVKVKNELEAKVTELQNQSQPLIDSNKEMKSRLELLSDENEGLQREVKSWQSRTSQLLEQSHRIGPQQYKNMTREIEELKNQKMRLVEELQKKQSEISSLNSNLVALQKQFESVKEELGKQKQQNEKLASELAEHQKTMLQVKKIGRKYKTQYDELKVAHDTLTARTRALESISQDQTMQELQKKLEDGEKALKELREESDKQKETALKTQKEFEAAQKQAIEKDEKAKKLLAQARQRINQINTQKNSVMAELEQMKNENSALKNASEDNARIAALKSQYDAKITHLEADLKAAKENGDQLKKQFDDLYQKMAIQQKQASKPVAVGGIVERGSTEPLTANIKPLSPAQASGSGLRPMASQSPRSTPTASIRPMAIGPVATASSSQARMAAVHPTTAASPAIPATSDEGPSPVPQAAVQPTPATATVAPTTVAATITPSSHTPVISELTPTPSASVEPQPSVDPVPSIHISPAHATALVCPRVEEVPDSVPVEGPAPTTSVIVSPPATQTQLVTPTIKRKLDDNSGSSESAEGATLQKRVRMISEGSQTNQQPGTSAVLQATAAVVPVVPVVTRTKPDIPTSEVTPSVHVETMDVQPSMSAATIQPPTSGAEPMAEDRAHDEVKLDEAIDVEGEEGDQAADWKTGDGKPDGDFEVMEDEDQSEQMEEFEEDEQMQPFPAPTEDEDMVEDSNDNINIEAPEMPNEIFDDLDGGSDTQMEAESTSVLPAPAGDQLMAPPASPMTQAAEPADAVPDTVIEPVGHSRRGSRQSQFPVRQDRVPPVVSHRLIIPRHNTGYEDGDDSIVPSTPTLNPPRRDDGFAEVSSPHVPPPARFSFSSTESSPTQQGRSQLEGALGVDDTRIDLSQFDEGGGRTVPSTPLQVSPPDETSLTVPEISEPSDVEVSVDSAVPVIRIESVESLSTQHSDTVAAEQISSEGDQEIPSGEQSMEAAKGTSEEGSSTLSLASASADSEMQRKEPSSAEGDSAVQVPATQSVRKPIVWEKDSIPATATPSVPAPTPAVTPAAPAPAQFSPPVGSEPTTRVIRARRARFRGNAANNSGFGRGATNWPQRRGRGAARRGRMF